MIPSVDDYDMTELKNLVEELQQESQQEEEEGTIDSSSKPKGGDNGEYSDMNKSTLALFDKLQAKEDKELDDSVSSVRSSNSFRSVPTRKGKLTVLN